MPMGTAWILCFLVFGAILTLARASGEVELRVNITAEKLILQCEVPANGLRSTTNLYCPLTGMSPCFENCVRSCIVIRGRCIPLAELKSTSCMRRRENDKEITTYTLNAKDPRNKGKWYCVHGGKESSGFIIDEMMTPKIITTLKPSTSTIPLKTTTTPQPKPKIKKTPIPVFTYKPKVLPTTEPIPVVHHAEPIDFIRQLTRPDLIIALLTLLALSLIINLAFCIRCILVRRYIEIQRAGYKESPCLAACLCISRHDENKPPPKVPRDCIYEEITTVNNGIGRARRPSNCSSTQRTFTTSLDGTGIAVDGRNTVLRRASLPRSRTFPVKAIGVPAHCLQQRPSYIYVTAAENGMLLEPVLTTASRVSSLYDDVASEGLQSLAASTSAIYASVQRTSQQIHDRHAQKQLQRKLQLQCELQEQLEVPNPDGDVVPQQEQQVEQEQRYSPPQFSQTFSRQRSRSPPSPLPERNDEQSPLTGARVFSPTPAIPRGSAEMRNSPNTGDPEDYDVSVRGSISPCDVCDDDAPRNNARLQLSKTLLQKADTLLREAGCLLD